MRCEELMRRPVKTCRETENVRAAARLMRDANVGLVPICDERGKLRGVVTDRDLAVRVLADGRPAADVLLRDAMSTELLTCGPDQDVNDAMAWMAARRKSRIVVTDAEGRPLGVISLSDLTRLEAPEAAQALRAISAREVVDRGGLRSRHA